eukprot:INCI7890.1.p1 GENE.INCI7890.1~~INCI7890.1.p1  ORF type:complete len:427 (-),score=107.43 INCI7890.1:80-1360(-)
MSSFSTAERRAALLFVQLIGELTERDGGDSEALLLASESVSSAFGVDADRDAASLNPSGARLLDILEEALAAVTEASAAKPTAEERIPLLATLRNSPKFNKYLEVVTSKGIFKGAEVGSDDYIARLQKVVNKFVSTFPAEVEAARSSAPAKLVGEAATAAADNFKNEGNDKLKASDFRGAIGAYSRAIETDSSGPNAHVYYANRAAARQHLGDFAGAAEDSRNSIRANPKYVKSYTRLAQACMSLKQWSDAIDACEKALEIDETNATASAFLAKAQRMQAAAPAEGQSPSASTPAPAAAAGGMPDLSGLLGAMGGGGGGGGGGMPDLGAMMNNPMMQNMMQNMMSNPEMMQNMMSSVGKMMGGAGGAGGAGGMPDLSAMMNDPNIRQMAEQVRGSMGATPNAGAAGASDDVEIENADEADEAEEVN